MQVEQGWSPADVDEWDFFYYLDLLIYKANKKQPRTTIDQVF